MTATIVELGRGGGRARVRGADRHIGARLREQRLLLGLTQQQVAELAGITHQQAQKYESGAERISAGRLLVLARALGVEPGHFFEGLGPGVPARPPARRRQVLELAQSFAALPPWQREAIAEFVRALAGAGADVA